MNPRPNGSSLLAVLAVAGTVLLLPNCDRSKPPAPPQAQDPHGYFLINGARGGTVNAAHPNPSEPDGVAWDPTKDPRWVNRLDVELTYVDPIRRNWVVPPGTQNDGASVPPFLNQVAPGQLNSNAFYAAVVHDYFCDQMQRPGQEPAGGYAEVHRVFYHALLCCKVDKKMAGLMYVAVNKFGPPQGRSLWARLLTETNPELVREAAADRSHPLTLWLEDHEIVQQGSELLIVDQETFVRMEVERAAIAEAQAREGGALARLDELKNTAEQMNELFESLGGGMVDLADADRPEEMESIARYRKEMDEAFQELKDDAEKLKAEAKESEEAREEARRKLSKMVQDGLISQAEESAETRRELASLRSEIDAMDEASITPEALDELLKNE